MTEVFVIEDDADLVYIYRTALAQAGYEVTMARSGSEAREALQQSTPDLVFLDMGMPDESGASLIRYMRSLPRFNNTRIVVVTATEGWEKQLNQDDITRFLVKPVTISELVHVANSLLDSSRADHATR